VVRDLLAPVPKWTISIEDDAVASEQR